jgi:uncharacterized membrane protein
MCYAMEAAPLFEAVIVPHRSLSPGGLRRVMGALVVLSGGVSTIMALAGAWPVLGFAGLEIGLAVVLLRYNARNRPMEIVLLHHDSVLIRRTGRGGRRVEHRLPSAWLQVVVEERPGRAPGLLLAAHGVQAEIGAQLGEAEKRDLAQAFAAALDRQRRPVFDNPQLRPDPG